MNRASGTTSRARGFLMIAVGAALLIGTWVSETTAGQGDDLFAQGNQAYAAGKYDEAISCYHKVIQEAGYSAPLLYNMANAYYRKMDVGRAILNYERALYLDPGNGDIRANLALARKDVGQVSNPALSWRRPFDILNVNGWAWMLSATFGVFSLMILLRGIQPARFQKRAFRVVMTVAILLLLTGGVGVTLHRGDLSRGVVTTDHAQLRVSPFDSAASSRPIEEGRIVRMSRTYCDYVWVKGEDGQSGWIKKDAVEPVIPAGNEAITSG